MKICYLDANLLAYYSNKNSPFHQKVRQLLKKLTAEEYELALSSLCLDEYIHTSLRFSEESKQNSLASLKKTLRKIFKLPKLRLINAPLETKKHLKVVNLIAKYNFQPRDAYHLFIMLENKIKNFATFDNDFKKAFDSGVVKKFT